MMMMRFRRVAQLWNWLPGFRGVAEHESVHKAAQTLGISPSALSRTVKLLESELGAPLFVRQGTGLVLTDLGADLLATTRDAMRQIDDCIARDEARRGGLGPLAIGVTCDASAAVTARSLAMDVVSAVTVMRIDEDLVADELLHGNVDLAVTGATVRAPELITERIGDVNIGLYAAADHPLTRETITPERLEAARFVVVAADDAISSERIGCHCDSIEVARAICESSNLLCVLPDVFVAKTSTLHRLADHGEPRLLHAIRRRPLPGAREGVLVELVERLRGTLAR